MQNVSQHPRVRVSAPAVDTWGDIAGDLVTQYGLIPDEWQQIVLDDWLARGDSGWANLTCGLSVPRQNGKNALIEMREIFGLVGRGEKILHTAHEIKTALKAFQRLRYFFGDGPNDPGAKFPELNAMVAHTRNVNGQQALHLKNGGSVEVIARSKNSGRGFTVDTLIFDEAQEMSDEDLEALMPTTSSAPLGDPQWIFTGTPPGPKARGEVFTRTHTDAISGTAYRLAWHEWSADLDDDIDDIRTWAAANPALATGRLQKSVVEGERSRFADDSFMRERLGMWQNAGTSSVIPSEIWMDVADQDSIPVNNFSLAVDVSPDRGVASIALGGQRADGLWHVELYEQKQGVGWLVPYLIRTMEKNPEVRALVIDAASPAASIVDELRQQKVKVTTSNSRDMAAACGQFYDGVVEQWLRHTDQPQMNYAVASSRKRPLGDSWAWNRKDSASDITPLVACTLALWGAQNSAVKRPRRRRGNSVFRG